jgi:putative transposase
MQVFDNEDDYEYFLTLLKIELEKENIGLYAYCLMSNHFHLLMVASVNDVINSALGFSFRYAWHRGFVIKNGNYTI